MRSKYLDKMLLTLLLVLSFGTGVQAGLLDVGPVVPQVLGSSEGTFQKGDSPLGHGFPLWYRDTNRLPLELCLDRADGQCATFEPTPGAALTFPDPQNNVAGNFSDEAFWWSADASIVQGDVDASLGMALEAAFSTGDAEPGAQVSFGRIRIRVDGLPSPGVYTVTTPYKQYSFTVVTEDGENAINFTEDIGIVEGGIFTGALNGNIDPFLYCVGAPFDINGAKYLAPSGGVCTNGARGGSFPDKNQNAYSFSVVGPGVNISTGQFTIIGKIYSGVIPTPLTVDKVSYIRNASGVQTSVFATTQAMSNKKVGGIAFPGQFALTNTPSALQLTGTDIPTVNLATNDPQDGKFYAASDIFSIASLPDTVTVTNIADDSLTNKIVPLVDEVVVTESSYAPANQTLRVAAASLDKVALPVLEVFMADDTVLPDKKVSLGIIGAGLLSVTFPANLSGKEYNIPPSTVTVESSAGGSATAVVNLLLPTAAPVGVNDAVTTPYLTPVNINVLANDITSAALNPATVTIVAQQNGTAVANLDRTVTFTPAAAFSGTASFSYTVRDMLDQISTNAATATITVSAPLAAVSGLTVTPDQASPQPFGTNVVFTAAAQGSSNYLYRFLLDGNEVQPFGPTATWTMSAATPPGNHQIGVEVKTNPLTASDRAVTLTYQVSAVITKSPGDNGTITGPTTVPYGTAATFTITPNVGFHVADVLVNGVSVGAVSSHTVSSITANTTVSATFSDAQIIWRNTTTGQNQIWFMNGAANTATKTFQTISDLNWYIVGRGDFNNDGRPDLLWRNISDGQHSVWYMDGITRIGSATPPALADQNWKVVGVADSNGDGKNDIYWRNISTGQNVVWYMDGVTRTGSAFFPTLADQNWEIAGVGDSNGDGKPDIFWRNVANGQNSVWYMDGITRTGSAILPVLADLNWQIVGVRAYNGDTKPDLLWRNVSNGQNAIWYMDGVTRIGSATLPPLTDQNWKIVGR